MEGSPAVDQETTRPAEVARTVSEREYEHPMKALAEELFIDRRSNENNPHYVLRFSLFLLPSLALFLIAPFVLPRDIALTIASATLGVQLAVPYRSLSDRFVGHLNAAREQRLSPTQYVRVMSVGRWGPRRSRIEFVVHDQATRSVGMRTTEISGAALLRHTIRYRLMMEPAWRRYFWDMDGRLINQDGSMTRAADIRAEYDRSRWMVLPVRVWFYVRAGLTLEKVGSMLLRVSLDPDGDLSARTLATQLGLSYDPRLGWWSRTRRQIRIWTSFAAPRRRSSEDKSA